MLDLGAKVTTSSSLQNSSLQSNLLTINVGDGRQSTDSTNSQTPTQQTKQEQTTREDATASVGVGLGGSGSGGSVARSGDVAPIDDFFTKIKDSVNWNDTKPYFIVGGIAAAFMFFLYPMLGKKKKAK
ncbi:hypothetical protein [Halarcobacter ebronensis]|uniref:Uncharacterized protein n=1 Tax=Halarcobacter ebronensis TaxID=1462615 RepID=A0A4Q1ANR6_9BACT|nr:hypothetical protein [Halarcobacter ebronensis]QKF82053.1 hypothetical protein AEBR_1570 [Halarcobacter ebronensis]RXK04114.1 hypothetical protein CRV07_11855 [Halarcobacter ebronensis]